MTKPMPGATRTGLPFKDITAHNFMTLKASDAVNFTHATPIRLPVGSKLYRVFGGPAGEIGGYWSAAPPSASETEAYWRGTNAVELSWNDGSYVSELTAKKEIQAWVGGVAAQPAQDIERNYITGFYLPGGATQFKVMSQIDQSEVQLKDSTPWPKLFSTSGSAERARAKLPSVSGPKPQVEHVEKLLELGHQMQSTGGSSEYGDQMSTQSQKLDHVIYDFHLALSQLDSSLSFAQIQQQIQAHIGLARHIYIPHDWPNAAELNQALEDVISSAYQMMYSD